MRRIAVIIATLVLGIDAAAAADPHGIWLRQSGSSKIRIEDCGADLCGTVVWEKTPRKDVYNPDAARRDDPITGRKVLLGMKPTGKPDQWKGEVYNAEDGKTYTGFITLKSSNEMALEGCVLGGLICKTDVWSRSH